MLKPLRLRLTLLYLAVAMLLAGLVGVSAYSMLYYYFQNNNDSALKFKMAETYTLIDVKLPSDLKNAQQKWTNLHTYRIPTVATDNHDSKDSSSKKDNDDSKDINSTPTIQETYEGELSSIFVLPLDESGVLMYNPNPYQLPMAPDQSAVQAALAKGSDLRNSTLNDGTPVRLLTYNVPKDSGYGLVQMGKPIGDQMRVMRQLISGLLLVGVISILLLGVGSWWMAGRSLRATQYAWDMQQAFVANASHELKAPLTLMRASAEVAQRNNQPNPQRSSLMKNIIEEVDHMAQLVEDLLLLSRLDSHQLKIEKQPLDLAARISELARHFEPLANARQVTFLNQVNSGKVQADITRLRQVMIILLDNALRHTPEGGTITIQSKVDGRNQRITISDNGEGIAPEHLPHLFERFYQVDSTRTKDQKGNGLGLSIAKSLVELQDGQISITSQPGQGTSINIILPRA